jgi:hypothetical protein
LSRSRRSRSTPPPLTSTSTSRTFAGSQTKRREDTEESG